MGKLQRYEKMSIAIGPVMVNAHQVEDGNYRVEGRFGETHWNKEGFKTLIDAFSYGATWAIERLEDTRLDLDAALQEALGD